MHDSKRLHTAATNASNLQKHQQFVCLSDLLRKQSTIGTQGAIEQKMLLFIILYKEHNHIIKSETMFNNIDIIPFCVYNIKHKERCYGKEIH